MSVVGKTLQDMPYPLSKEKMFDYKGIIVQENTRLIYVTKLLKREVIIYLHFKMVVGVQEGKEVLGIRDMENHLTAKMVEEVIGQMMSIK